MKRNSIILLSLLILAFTSCKKELSNATNDKIPDSDMKVSTLIKNFKARGESGFKSGEEMDIETAIWYLGVTANYTYGDASREIEKTWTDTCYLSIPINNNKISASEVYNKYIELIENLRQKYQAKNEENKQLITVSVKTRSLVDNILSCEATAVFAYGGPIQVACSFNNIDYWSFWWYVQGGICDGPNFGTNLQSDAAEETQKRIMACKGVPIGNYYYEELLESPIRIENPLLFAIDSGVEISNNRYSHLYWNCEQYPNFDGCISPADLNFYLTKTRQLINNDTEHNGIRPVGSSFISIDMWGFQDYNFNNYLIYEHKASVRYGILHLSPDPRESLD
jgi:hypothetical protein